LAREATLDITEWLRSLGLEQYAPAFEQNHIGPELLPTLSADDLKELGIASLGHRRAILAAIAGLRAAAEISAPAPAAGSPLPDPPPLAGEGRVRSSPSPR
jgi:hypothetical protein